MRTNQRNSFDELGCGWNRNALELNVIAIIFRIWTWHPHRMDAYWFSVVHYFVKNCDTSIQPNSLRQVRISFEKINRPIALTTESFTWNC